MSKKALLSLFSLVVITSAVFIVFTTGCGNKKSDSMSLNNDSITPEIQYDPLEFKLYIENSGSMAAYDNSKTDGDFRNIVSGMLNHLPTQNNDTVVYVVNDAIYPYKSSIADFLKKRNFMADVKSLGNINYTDFQKIFTQIEDSLQDNQVAILFSDLIYSLKDQQDVNVKQLLNEAERITENVTKNHPDVQVMVIKFEADYNGKYYPYNSPNKGIEYAGKRPLYAMIFAKTSAMDALWNDSKNSEFMNFSKIPGYRDMFFFTKNTYEPFYSVIMKDYGKKGHYDKNREETTRGGAVRSITNAKAAKDGELVIPIAIDLSRIPVSEDYKTDLDNYTIDSESDYEIVKIEPVGKKEKSLGNATHIITIETSEKISKKDDVAISMRNIMPKWIEETGSDDDCDINNNNFSTTTFGFENMMEGIYDAKISDEDKSFFFTISVIIKK